MAYPAALLDGSNIGKADAPVTLDVREDYQCPICARYDLTVEPVLVSQYATPGSLRIVHHEISRSSAAGAPTTSSSSTCAAEPALCESAGQVLGLFPLGLQQPGRRERRWVHP